MKLEIKEEEKSCTIDTPYTFRKIALHKTGFCREVSKLQFLLEDIDPGFISCFFGLDTSQFPYINVTSSRGEISYREGIKTFELKARQMLQLEIQLDTGHKKVQPLSSLLLEFPLFFSLTEEEEPSYFKPVLVEEAPCFLKYEILLEECKRYPGVIGIDFGTTSTCISFLPQNIRDLTPEILQIGGLTELPTLLYFEEIKAKGKEVYNFVSGLATIGGLNPGSLVRGIKRYLGARGKDNLYSIYTESSSFEYSTEELVAFYLNRLQEEFVENKNYFFGTVGNTFPCNLGRLQKKALIESYKKLEPEIPEGSLKLDIDEPTAAAIFYTIKKFDEAGGTLEGYVQKLHNDISSNLARNMLVFDFGGGTTDIALVSIFTTLTEMRFKVLGNTSIKDFGGDNVTLVLLKRLKAHFCYILTQKSEEVDEIYKSQKEPLALICNPDWYQKFKSLKQNKSYLKTYLEKEALGEKVHRRIEALVKEIIPTNFAQLPPSTYEQQNALKLFNILWDCCEQIKISLCQLSRKAIEEKIEEDIKFQLEDTMRFLMEQLGIEDESFIEELNKNSLTLEKDIYPFISKPLRICMRAMRLLCMENQEQKFHTIDEVRLVGNSCKIPLVKKLMIEEMKTSFIDQDGCTIQFNSDPENIIYDVDKDAKTSVSKGRAIAMTFDGRREISLHVEEAENFLPYEIGLKNPAEPWYSLFPRGTKTPCSAVYKPRQANLVDEIEIFMRICKWQWVKGDKREKTDDYEPPIYPVGKFVFSEKYATPGVEPVDDIVIISKPKGEFEAVKGCNLYTFLPYYSNPPETDPFSGIH